MIHGPTRQPERHPKRRGGAPRGVAMAEQANEQFLPADQIPVNSFREILIWPLALHLASPSAEVGAMLDAVSWTVDDILRNSRTWEPVDDPSEHVPQSESYGRREWRAHRYQEAVYFHEFVQRFLFSPREPRVPGEPDPVPFRLFRRTDITEVKVTLADPDSNRQRPGRLLRLAVERVNLYLFRMGAAILVVEVASKPDRDLRLSDVQNFHDQFRRAYIPYVPACIEQQRLVICKVVWLLRDGRSEPSEIGEKTADEMVAAYLDRTTPNKRSGLRLRSAPLFRHWLWLLDGALNLPSDPDERGGRWYHVVDERMPTITTVSVTPAFRCTGRNSQLIYFGATGAADLARLCFADSAGSGQALFYDARSFAEFEAKHVYSAYRDSGTLFLVSGYAFVAFGAGWFFDNIIAPIHMRRHYFQIGLLAHFELASLLTFSSRISRAVAAYDPRQDREQDFERVMHAIEDEYLQFMHRFRFTGVSNQLQAHELTTLWRNNLRLDDVFKDLHTEITSAADYLFNRAASRGARTAERLTVIGTYGVIGALIFSFLGMNILIQQTDLASYFHLLNRLGLGRRSAGPLGHELRRVLGEASVFFCVLAIFVGLGAWLLARLRRITQPNAAVAVRHQAAGSRRRGPADLEQRISRQLCWIAGAAGVMTVICLAISVML